jgi:hypothetical protein
MLMMLVGVVVLLAVNDGYLQDLIPMVVALVVLSKVCVALPNDWTAETHLALVVIVGELLLLDHHRLMHLTHHEN